jgi:dsDNA-binding SOS-regulon protein
MSAELLKQAADQIEKLVAQNTELQAQLAKHAETKLASDKADADAKAKIADLAKVAAQNLRNAGLLSTDEKRDAFAAKLISSPDTALDCLAKTAEFVRAPKLGSVVVETTAKTASANDSWDQAVARGLSRA